MNTSRQGDADAAPRHWERAEQLYIEVPTIFTVKDYLDFAYSGDFVDCRAMCVGCGESADGKLH